MPDDLHEVAIVWRTAKMLSPLLLLIISALGGMIVWYLKKMVDAVERLGLSHERMLQTIDDHGRRIERVEDKVL